MEEGADEQPEQDRPAAAGHGPAHDRAAACPDQALSEARGRDGTALGRYELHVRLRRRGRAQHPPCDADGRAAVTGELRPGEGRVLPQSRLVSGPAPDLPDGAPEGHHGRRHEGTPSSSRMDLGGDFPESNTSLSLLSNNEATNFLGMRFRPELVIGKALKVYLQCPTQTGLGGHRHGKHQATFIPTRSHQRH